MAVAVVLVAGAVLAAVAMAVRWGEVGVPVAHSMAVPEVSAVEGAWEVDKKGLEEGPMAVPWVVT